MNIYATGIFDEIVAAQRRGYYNAASDTTLQTASIDPTASSSTISQDTGSLQTKPIEMAAEVKPILTPIKTDVVSVVKTAPTPSPSPAPPQNNPVSSPGYMPAPSPEGPVGVGYLPGYSEKVAQKGSNILKKKTCGFICVAVIIGLGFGIYKIVKS